MKTPICDGYWWVRLGNAQHEVTIALLDLAKPYWVQIVGSDELFDVRDFEWLEPIKPPESHRSPSCTSNSGSVDAVPP